MQAIESASLSLAEFRLRSGFADSRESLKLRRRDVSDGLKTVFWAFSLLARTGLASGYGLERHFEPEAFGKTTAGDRFHRNKWRSYLTGQHEPMVVLEAVESKCPGANACLASPLWPALTARVLTRSQLEALVLPLDAGIQALVRRRGTSPRPSRFPKMAIDRGLAEALERRASLDALAATVLLLRISHLEGESAASYQWGCRVLRIMVMLGKLLQAGGIARALLELIEARVMPMAQHDGARPGFPAGSFVALINCYEHALNHIKGMPIALMTEAERHAIGQRILDRRYGHDYFYALNPVRLKAAGATESFEDEGFATPDIWLHTWAHNMLSAGGHRDAPPEEVRSAGALWAKR